MLSKQRRAQLLTWDGYLDVKRLKCLRCGVHIDDSEPANYLGEFVHPDNGCANAGLRFSRYPEQGRTRGAKGIVPVGPKRYERAKKRGARRAKKYRPG